MGNDNRVRVVFVVGNKMGGDSAGIEAGGNDSLFDQPLLAFRF
jgi:hypothetical protein